MMESIHKALSEMEEREKAATKGPWLQGDWLGRCNLNHRPHGIGACKYEYRLVRDDYYDRFVSKEPNITIIGSDENGPILSRQNAAFIAHSRQDLPKLIKALRKSAYRLVALKDDAESAAVKAWAEDGLAQISSILSETPNG